MQRRGFTLLEILIALATVGILAAIAYPNYASHVVKARRAEAQASLLELMQQQERYYTDHNTYLAFSASVPSAPFKWYSGASAASSAYELSGQACKGHTLATCIALAATPGTPRVDQQFRDSECETLHLDSEGAQGASGRGERCWP